MDCYASHLSCVLESKPNRRHGHELSLLKRRLQHKREVSTASISFDIRIINSCPSSSSIETISTTDNAALTTPPTVEKLPPQIEPSSADEQLPSSAEPPRDGGHHPGVPFKSFEKLVVKWSCTTCNRECIPVREESRCLW